VGYKARAGWNSTAYSAELCDAIIHFGALRIC